MTQAPTEKISAQTQVTALAEATVRLTGRPDTLQVAADIPDGSTPPSIEGPYYVAGDDPELVRSDIGDGKPGIPLELVLTVLDAVDHRPVRGAVLDLWHCDASGYYSGHDDADPDAMPALQPAVPPHDDSRDLRGVQRSDEQGTARFRTVYPGWYWGRGVHIHVKIWIDDRLDGMAASDAENVYTGQLYLPEQYNSMIESLPPYDRHVVLERVPNHLDDVYLQTGGESLILAVEPRAGDVVDVGLIAGYTFVVDLR